MSMRETKGNIGSRLLRWRLRGGGAFREGHGAGEEQQRAFRGY